MKSLIRIVGSIGLIVFGLTACKSTDVVLNKSIESFKAIEGTLSMTEDASVPAFVMSAPDQSVALTLSTNLTESTDLDVYMRIDAAPFIEAGLDVSLLPEGTFNEGFIVLGQALKDAKASNVSAASALETLIVANRDILGFHENLGHYNISLGNGNLFEWAEDASTNDKDIVFVLDPQIFVDAKVDPTLISGWVYAEVMVMDASGKEVTVNKLLKPFDLQ